MTEQEFLKALDELEDRIEAVPSDKHHVFQAELHGLIERMRNAGVAIPDRVRRMDAALTEDAIEAQFDNMPV
ncbi:MAG: hypothetical protein CSA70_10800 [Rhodobacterales bacterium]|nr:MAG: hypothetical protein CSA70_10800 [Rhodobacterales bacterium]